MSRWNEWIPESYRILKEEGYSFSFFRKDLSAGVTVGLIAISLAIGFAVASGADPGQGLTTAILGSFFVSLLGGSRVQIGGPTSFFTVLIFSILSKAGYQSLCASMVLAACFLIILSLLRLGSLFKYVSTSVITGCTCGIALSIFSLQLSVFLGLKGTSSKTFMDRIVSCYDAIDTFNETTFLVGILSLLLIFILKIRTPKAPWGLIVILLGTIATFSLNLPVATIRSAFGGIETHLPFPSFPNLWIGFDQIPYVVSNALVLTLLIGVESVISSLIGDGLLEKRPRPNCELMAQGIANLVVACFGGIPESGTIPRTVTNAKVGAQTPVAGMIHSVTIFCVLLFFSHILDRIPLVCLAAILMTISYEMLSDEGKRFSFILKNSYSEGIVFLSTFFLSVFFEIQTAIFIGSLISIVVFMHKTSMRSFTIKEKTPHEGVEIYKIEGPLFFGNINLLHDLPTPKVLLLDIELVPMIDVSGMLTLKELVVRCQKHETILLLYNMQELARIDFEKLRLFEIIKPYHIFSDKADALSYANSVIKFI